MSTRDLRRALYQCQATRFLLWLLFFSICCCLIQAEATATPSTQPQQPRNRQLSNKLGRHIMKGPWGLYYGINFHGIFSGRNTTSIHRNNSRSNAKVHHDRLQEYERIAREVEEWAEAMLNETGHDGTFIAPGSGWHQVKCNQAFRHLYNPTGQTLQFVKWMVDSRGDYADTSQPQRRTHLHPCMKLYGEIDAPFDLVCRYLSQQKRYREYNSLLIDQKDLNELTPHSKICWSQTKKLLFIQPRDFVTFCYHKWRKNGTQMIVHQAWEDPLFVNNKKGHLRAYALRGATWLSPHPQHATTKTRIVLLAHCNCGNDVPEWAVRTAVAVLAPIKPFEIIHRIQVGVDRARPELLALERQSDHSRSKRGSPERSPRPAGMAQMGYACFWPEGGGWVEQH